MSHDPTDDEPFDGPSRSQLRREALAVLALAEALVDLPDAELQRMPLDDDLVGEVRRARAVPQQIARKRQIQYLAKQMRKLDDEALAPLRAALAHDRAQMRRAAADLHQVERWRDRLIAEGDDAIGAWLALHPAADRQQLRALVRQAKLEADRSKPPRASRELFRLLRETSAAEPDDGV